MISGELRQESFNLLRSFAFLSLVCIVLISAVSAFLLSRFLKDNLLQRDAVVTIEFVQSIAQTQNTSAYFAELDYGKSKAALKDFFGRIAHMPDGGRLKVIGERLGAAVSVKVTDTGTGISEERLREVFKPLVTHKPNGLGVGLPLARRILQRLGGNLELFSREGTGTTAQLILPAANKALTLHS